MKIVPQRGFQNINFGISKDQACQLLGTKGSPDTYDDERELVYFDNGNLSLMFTKSHGLTSIYILASEEYRDTELWEMRIFYLQTDDIIKLLNEKGLKFKQSDYMFDDRDIIVEEAGIIFNFTDNNLEAVEIYNCDNDVIYTQIELQDN